MPKKRFTPRNFGSRAVACVSGRIPVAFLHGDRPLVKRSLKGMVLRFDEDRTGKSGTKQGKRSPKPQSCERKRNLSTFSDRAESSTNALGVSSKFVNKCYF